MDSSTSPACPVIRSMPIRPIITPCAKVQSARIVTKAQTMFQRGRTSWLIVRCASTEARKELSGRTVRGHVLKLIINASIAFLSDRFTKRLPLRVIDHDYASRTQWSHRVTRAWWNQRYTSGTRRLRYAFNGNFDLAFNHIPNLFL